MKHFLLLLLTACINTVLIAQEGGGATDVNVDINSDGGGFFTNPIVWVVGAAVFILLLVALLRGGKRND